MTSAVDFASVVRADPLFVDLAGRAAIAGVDVALVGGLPRDLLLGRVPRDADFVLAGEDAPAEALLHDLAATHGTRVLAFDRREIRERRIPLPGREVDFVLTGPGGLVEELRRRDFTLNAIAIRLDSGAVVDPFGGRADLARGLLRHTAPGWLEHDPLRALRAVRFLTEGVATRLDPDTAADIRARARLLPGVSGERLRGEMDRLASGPRFASALATCIDLSLLEPLLPECAALAGVGQNEFHHLDVWEHTLEAVRLSENPAAPSTAAWEPPAGEDLLLLRYAVLFHDLGKPATRSLGEDAAVHFFGHESVSARLAAAIAGRWRFPRRRTLRLVALIREHLRPGALGGAATEKALRRLVHDAGADLDLLLLLALADTGATRGRDFDARLASTRAACANLREMSWRLGETLLRPVPLLRGDEVMALLDLAPGPEVGTVLADLLRLQIEGSVSTRDEAVAAIRARPPSAAVKKPAAD